MIAEPESLEGRRPTSNPSIIAKSGALVEHLRLNFESSTMVELCIYVDGGKTQCLKLKLH